MSDTDDARAVQLAEWARAHEFVPTRDSSASWEIAWGHTSGYGVLIFRVIPQGETYPFNLVIEAGGHDYGVNLGVVRTIAEVEAVWRMLSGMNYDAYKENTSRRSV